MVDSKEDEHHPVQAKLVGDSKEDSKEDSVFVGGPPHEGQYRLVVDSKEGEVLVGRRISCHFPAQDILVVGDEDEGLVVVGRIRSFRYPVQARSVESSKESGVSRTPHLGYRVVFSYASSSTLYPCQ